ncbi:MAG: PhoU domain-containing protein [Nitrososphaera sp.]
MPATGQTFKEIRKIQLTGKSTFILSLPKKWIKEMRLAPGDQVSLVREPDTNSVSMIVEAWNARKTSSGFASAATIFVSAKDGPETLKRKVVALYLAGHPVINLKVKSGRINAALREAVRDLVRKNLIGTEMIADSSDEITLQVLLSIPELSVTTALRRMYLIASAMHKDALAALAEKNNVLAEGVIKTDDEVDRFGLYISRNLVLALRSRQILEEIGLQDPSDCLSYRTAVKCLERVGDHAAGIAEKTLGIEAISGEPMQRINRMSALSLSVLEDSVEALLKRDYQLADQAVDRAGEIYTLENDVIEMIEKKEADSVHSASVRLIIEDIRRTAEYASDIAETAINETIDEIISKDPQPEGQEKQKESARKDGRHHV